MRWKASHKKSLSQDSAVIVSGNFFGDENHVKGGIGKFWPKFLPAVSLHNICSSRHFILGTEDFIEIVPYDKMGENAAKSES